MMIESHLTLCAIVGNYRSNPQCSSATFLGMLETWAEEVFGAELRPIDYGLACELVELAEEDGQPAIRTLDQALSPPTAPMPRPWEPGELEAAFRPPSTPECPLEAQGPALQALQSLSGPQTPENGETALPCGENALSGRSSGRAPSCRFCGGAGSVPGILPWQRQSCRFCGGTGRGLEVGRE